MRRLLSWMKSNSRLGSEPSRRSFVADRRGNVAIVFAIASVAVLIGVGAGVDLARAYSARQKLSQVATLTCQYSTRPSVTAGMTGGSTGFSTYLTAVNGYATAGLSQQNWYGPTPTGTNGTYFTATAPAASSTSPTNPVTEIQVGIPTTLLSIVGVSSIPVHARIGCQTTATAAAIVTSPLVLHEGFETSCATYCFTNATGGSTPPATATSTVPASPSYTGSSGAQWYVLGYCLEVDAAGVISASDPEGTHSAELDCDNGSGTAGNSSISSKVTLSVGTYELRYYYRERVPSLTYDPGYVCGSAIAPDVNWVSNNTNQINVYLDSATGGFPTHKTLDSTQTLGGTNLIDTCVNSTNWIERSVVITVTTAGSYWLSFAADGTNDSYGGQIDDIQLCQGSCAGTVPDAFPPSYLTTPIQLSDVFSTVNSLGWNAFTKSSSVFVSPLCKTFLFCATPSRTVSSSVMLDPGFYELTYQYVSFATMPSPPAVGCGQTPTSATVTPFTTTNVTATNTATGVSYATKADFAFIGMLLAFPNQAVSPVVGGPVTATNPLVDACLYSANIISRAIGFEIQKPGYYALDIYAGGTAATPYEGGAVANVTVSAIGSPYTMSVSTACPAVPVPGNQLGASIAYSGFSFVVTNPFANGATQPSCAPK